MKLENPRDRRERETSLPSCLRVAPSLPSCWYLILTKPFAEESAKVNLERQGYRVYFPRLVQRRLYRGRWRDKISALFPRYLFVRLNIGSQALAPVRSTLGVAGVVRFGADYAVVPERVIQGLSQRADPQSGLHEIRHQSFTPGAAVRIVAGAFAGLDGIFEREIGEDRVVVLFNLLGREAHVGIAADLVAPGYV